MHEEGCLQCSSYTFHMSYLYIDDGIIDSVIYFMAYCYCIIYMVIFCYVDIVLGDPRDLYLIIPVHKLFQCRFSETIHENPGVLPGQQ